MRVGNFTSDKIKSITPDKSVGECLDTMQKYAVDALPVVRDGVYMGVAVRQDCIDADKALSVKHIVSPMTAINADAHILDALGMLSDKSGLLPVVDDNNHYIGCLTTEAVMQSMEQLCDTKISGTVLEMKMLPEDYSLTQLSRIVEENGCKIANVFVFPDEKSGLLRVQFRVTCENVSPILQSLERFGYNVACVYAHEKKADEKVFRRLQELMYYLEM